LLARLADASPRLRELAHDVAEEERAIALAEKDYYPDVTLGVAYIDTGSAIMSGVRESSKDPILASISINLPIWLGKRRAAVAEARQRRRSAQRRKADVENTLAADVKLAYYAFRDAERKIDLFGKALLPKAEQALKATEAAYRAGKGTFSDLVDAERMRLEFALAYARAVADYNQQLARLEMLVGRPLPRLAGADAGVAPEPEEP
jgi:outer membrane protein TolC